MSAHLAMAIEISSILVQIRLPLSIVVYHASEFSFELADVPFQCFLSLMRSIDQAVEGHERWHSEIECTYCCFSSFEYKSGLHGSSFMHFQR